MKPQLCLGTAQFGLHYGITNIRGKVSEDEVRVLLEEASAAGLALLDTAQAYGDAESVLGRVLPPGHGFKLITKLPPQVKPSFTADDYQIWENAFKRSLVCLGQPAIDGLLLHRSSDLCKPGSEHLREWLLSLRERGLVQRLGVSIYDRCDLYCVSPDLLDMVQLPLSLYDQRLLVDGTIAYLRDQDCSVYARSLYLQGLLLCPSEDWPAWVDPAAREHHSKLEIMASDRGCTLLECALGFASEQRDIEAVVLGVSSKYELLQLLQAWHSYSPWDGDEWSSWNLNGSEILDPRRWP